MKPRLREQRVDITARIDKAIAAGIVISNASMYAAFLEKCKTTDYVSAKAILCEGLSTFWVDEYLRAMSKRPEIVEFSDSAYSFLFDYDHERVVVAFGETREPAGSRDAARQKGFIPSFTKFYPNKDRGHFLSHASGGLMDVNFFPQKKEINRGWSPAGKIYRAMEKHCASHSGTFVFSHPIYTAADPGWDPEQLEYGFYDHDREFRAILFPNR